MRVARLTRFVCLFSFALPPVAAQQPRCNGTCEPDPSSITYQQTVASRTLVQNQRSLGPSPMRHANSTKQAANPGSTSYSYAIPVIHLPGRNGLDLDLTLYYNSHLWNTAPSSNVLTLNADRDFPDYGFRLDFGYMEIFGGTCGASGATFILTEPDGTKRQLSQTSGNNYRSTDATYIDFNCSTGLLQRRDGTRWTYTLGNGGTTTVWVPTQIKDPNGNYISISYVANPSPYNPKIKPQDIASITDTLGRQITYNYETTDYKLLSISGPAPGGGTQNYISLTWGTKTLLYSFSGLTVDDSVANNSTINIITACTYPNGTGYSFTWGDWATISKISQLSANGTVRNYVQYNFPSGTTALTQPPTYTQETLFDGVTTSNWTYSAMYSTAYLGDVIATSITDPSGTVTTTNYYDPTNGALAGLPSSTVITSGTTTLRTAAITWTTDTSGNPRISSVTTTLNDSGQQTKVAYTYDSYYNITQVSEYDYGLALTRQTQTTYQTASTYLNQHIYSLPTQVKILDGGNNIVARTDYSYDAGTLSSFTGATNHDDANYGSGFTTRGNLTSATRYTNAAAGTGAISRAFTYDIFGNVLTAQVDCCQQQQFTFASATQYAYPASVVKGSGTATLTTSFTYDFNSGLLLSAKDPNNQTTSLQYDSSGRVTKLTRPDQQFITTSYDDAAALPAATTVSPLDSSNNITTIKTIDGAGHTLKTESKNGTIDIISEQQYDTFGRPSQSSNPHSPSESALWTTYAYDTLSRATTVTPPGSAGTYQYSYSGNQTTITDPAGLQRKKYADALGRLIRVDEPGYDDGGHGTGTVTISGSEACIGSPCEIYDSATITVTVGGCSAHATSHKGSTSITVASALASSFNGNSGCIVTAGSSGSLVTLTSKLPGYYTNYSVSISTFDSDPTDFGDGSFSATPSGPTLTGGTDGTGANGHAPSLATPNPSFYAYDQLDDLLTVAQGVQTRSFVFDSLGRLTTATLPESGATSYTYTSYGLVSTRTDARNVVSTYNYDGLNRLSSVSYDVSHASSGSATPTVNFYYDEGGTAANALGRLTHVTDGVGSETYQYDVLGRATTLTKVISGVSYPLTYGYNLASESTSVGYPSGRTVQQTFDPIGRLSQLSSGGTNYVSNLQYNSASEPLSFSYGNGVQAAFSYNSRLQLGSLAYTKGTSTIFSANYWYSTDATKCPSAPAGNNGQIQCITDNVDATRSTTYAFDAWARLKTASNAQWGLSWVYDRYGNRTTQIVTAGTGVPSNALTISTATNRVVGASYDAAGNMTNDNVNTLTYDAENKVVTNLSNGVTTTYSLDGSGLRVKKAVQNGATTVYIFSGSKVLAEYDNGAAVGSPSREYIYAGAQLVAKIEGSSTSYFHSDHLSARAITDSSGNVAGTRAQYPFGETWYETGAITKWRFTSYERDNESGNDYAMARTYINRLARFNSPDPIAGSPADPQSLNRYAYTRNDPADLTDPSGLYWYCVWYAFYANGAELPGSQHCHWTWVSSLGSGGGPGGNLGGTGDRGGGGQSGSPNKPTQPDCIKANAALKLAIAILHLEAKLSGLTIGEGIGGSVGAGLGGKFGAGGGSSLQLVVSPNGQAAVASSVSAGGVSGWGLLVGPQFSISNAPRPQDLGGPFGQVSGSIAARGVGAGADVLWGKGSTDPNRTIWQVSVDAGIGTGGKGVFGGVSNAIVTAICD